MPSDTAPTRATAEFSRFVERAEPRLRRALVAAYGPVLGREAAVDALSWAWENWERLGAVANPIGYLFRVGQSAARAHLGDRSLTAFAGDVPTRDTEIAPELLPALTRLSYQQRAAVILVHGYAMSLREAAGVLGVSVATLREHLARGMARLRADLEEAP